jgi:hypothetical protein
MATELRCEAKLHGVLEDGVIEVRCRSAFCGARAGVVIIHRFHAMSGDLLETKKFRDPTSNGRRAG